MREISQITANFPRNILLHEGMWVEFLANSSIYFVLPIYSFWVCNYSEGIDRKFLWPSTDLSFLPLPIRILSPSTYVATKTTPVATQLSRQSRIMACLALTAHKPGVNRHLAKKLSFSCVRKPCSSLPAPQDLVLPYSLCFLFYQRVPKICRETGDVTS